MTIADKIRGVLEQSDSATDRFPQAREQIEFTQRMQSIGVLRPEEYNIVPAANESADQLKAMAFAQLSK